MQDDEILIAYSQYVREMQWMILKRQLKYTVFQSRIIRFIDVDFGR